MIKLIQNELDKLYDNVLKFSNHETAKKIAYGVDNKSISSDSEKKTLCVGNMALGGRK